MHKLGRQHLKDAEELNITAFMNLMVILVPFLLITAVFSRMTILGLNLPVQNSSHQQNSKIRLSLEIVLNRDGFDIQDTNIGQIKHIDITSGNIDWLDFDKTLLEIKRRFPKSDSVTLLVEPDVPYRMLIHVMDHVKSTQVALATGLENVQLFPNISIGNAQSKNMATKTADAAVVSKK